MIARNKGKRTASSSSWPRMRGSHLRDMGSNPVEAARFSFDDDLMRGTSAIDGLAHNQKVTGSKPVPATTFQSGKGRPRGFRPGRPRGSESRPFLDSISTARASFQLARPQISNLETEGSIPFARSKKRGHGSAVELRLPKPKTRVRSPLSAPFSGR